MHIDIVTLFPEMFTSVFGHSILKRAQHKGKVSIAFHNLRKWAVDARGTVDEKPFGGGPGMLLRPEPIYNALTSLVPKKEDGVKTLLFTPQGTRLTQHKVEYLAHQTRLIIVCGHYEGVDERVRAYFDEQISIGDYVLSGGELAAMVLTDAVARLVPGVLGKDKSNKEESFSLVKMTSGKSKRLIEYPQYTQPRVFRGKKVPAVLLSGHHKKIQEWQIDMALAKTLRKPGTHKQKERKENKK